jgi:hypothetical protein
MNKTLKFLVPSVLFAAAVVGTITRVADASRLTEILWPRELTTAKIAILGIGK